jgi:hypothetical protein
MAFGGGGRRNWIIHGTHWSKSQTHTFTSKDEQHEHHAHGSRELNHLLSPPAIISMAVSLVRGQAKVKKSHGLPRGVSKHERSGYPSRPGLASRCNLLRRTAVPGGLTIRGICVASYLAEKPSITVPSLRGRIMAKSKSDET